MRAASSSVGFNPRRLAVEVALGFVYWLSFVLVLEPGNLMHWVPPDAEAWGREALRLCAAGLLGAAATPAIVAVSRRFPVEGPSALRRVGVHVVFILAMTFALIVASSVFGRLMPSRVHRPFAHELGVELAANGALVAAWIAGLTVLIHAVRRASPQAAVAFRQRGRFARLDLAETTWIETQGNYLALHGGSGARLVRTTAKALATELERARFVRVHRRAFVALNAVGEVRPLAAGDAMLTLVDGRELRVSRTFRAQVLAALDELHRGNLT